ncbi:unnamed protein product [Oppiella nova]|uniref:Protein kinase domain-containing protein n=1 Tax=Oppiella nova TaxID=334625 RepID=A0A7R9MEZ8_9ACAR|nr:unnamed protein product [Oppiella nova]CAG2176149.1 unnamed protein product [Oppiella nova]
MILTSDCCVYGWGDNRDGKLGCGPDSDIQNGTIFRVNFSPNHEIKSIYCYGYSSYAITSEGQVYSWGLNEWYNLGHNSSDNIWKPKPIEDMTGIKTICSNGRITYFLSNDGFIHFCGEYRNTNNELVSEVNHYKRLYVEKDLLGSGGFGEVLTNFGNLCSDSLQNILQHKPQVFGRQPDEPMNSIEDLKSDNILLAKTVRNGRFFKVCDFGLATVHQHSSDKGDLRYQAPEVGQGVDYTHKIDVYSLAKIAEQDIFGIHLVDKP